MPIPLTPHCQCLLEVKKVNDKAIQPFRATGPFYPVWVSMPDMGTRIEDLSDGPGGDYFVTRFLPSLNKAYTYITHAQGWGGKCGNSTTLKKTTPALAVGFQCSYGTTIDLLYNIKAKMYAISSDTNQLQFIKLHHFKLEIFKSIYWVPGN